MAQFRQQPVQFPVNANIVWNWIDLKTGDLSAEGCANTVHLPMIPRTAPKRMGGCGRNQTNSNPTALDDLPEENSINIQRDDSFDSDQIELNNRSVEQNSFSDDPSNSRAIIIPAE